jgi:hypothetical protein
MAQSELHGDLLMSSANHDANDLDADLIYALPWAHELALSTLAMPTRHAGDRTAHKNLDPVLIYAPPRARELLALSAPPAAITQHAVDSIAYNVAIECAALCLIALEYPKGDQFRQHLREVLREALYLRGALNDNEAFVDRLEARKVVEDVAARASAFSSDPLPPLWCSVAAPMDI